MVAASLDNPPVRSALIGLAHCSIVISDCGWHNRRKAIHRVTFKSSAT